MASTEYADAGRYRYPSIALTTGLFVVFYCAYRFMQTFYNAFFGPLSKYPGPKIRAFTILPAAWKVATGRPHTDMLKLHTKYGPVVRYGPRHVIFLGSNQRFKDLYGFRKGGTIAKDPLFYRSIEHHIRDFGEIAPSIATADREVHTRQRKIFSYAFSDRALRAQEHLIKQWSTRLAKKLGECADSNDKVDLAKLYNCCTFSIMQELALGDEVDMLENLEYTPWVASIFAGIRAATIMRAFKSLGSIPALIIDQILFKSAAARQSILEHWRYSSERVDARLARGSTKPDLWTLVEDRKLEHGGLSRAEHHSNGNAFMIAGTETTATALSGATCLLLRNPDKLKKLTDEIRSAAKSQHDLRMDNLASLKYLHAVLQESLRMYPPAAVDLPRIVPMGGMVIDEGKWYLPQGTTVGISHYATFRSKENFHIPDQFVPERWLGDERFTNDNRDAMEPFSVGPRNCLGKSLAWHEMRILLATVLLECDLRLDPKSVDWIERQRVYTLWEKKPFMVSVTKVQH